MKRNAFTLIELLVVIAIIGMLLAVLIPALQYAKAQATGAVCLANMNGLAKAWYLYQEDNGGWLVGLSNYYSGGRSTPYRWVERPLYKDTDNPGAPPEGHGSPVPPISELCHEYRLNGIRAGKLFPYTKNVKLYHCPNDKLWKTESPEWAAYISYAGAGLVNSEDFITRTDWPGRVTGWRSVTLPDGTVKKLGLAERFSEIVSPGNKYMFVEEEYVKSHGQRFYAGGFVLMGNNQYGSWWDWPAYYHKDRSTLAFTDGHAEKHHWIDKRTIWQMKRQDDQGRPYNQPVQPDNHDLEWMIRGYLPMGWK